MSERARCFKKTSCSLSRLSVAFIPPPFPSFPIFPHLLPATAKESVEALKLLIRPGRSVAAKRHLVNLGLKLKECFW